MSETFELKNGRVLNLRGVNLGAIRHIYTASGYFSNNAMQAIVGGEDIEPERLAAGMREIVDASTRLFNYCIGWGVVDEPADEDDADIEIIGEFEGRARKIAWVRYCLLEDETEAAQLIGRIIALSG